MGVPAKYLTAFLGFVLGGCGLLGAQSSRGRSRYGQSPGEESYPEQAYLSPSQLPKPVLRF